LIFAGKSGMAPICYRKKWSSLTGMLRRPDLRIHDIRHWVAASLLRNGVGVGVASQILGHRDQTMLLRRYGHLDHLSLQEAQQQRWQPLSASAAQLIRPGRTWASNRKGRADLGSKTLYTLARSDEDPVRMGSSCGILAGGRVAQKSSSVKRNDASSPKDVHREIL